MDKSEESEEKCKKIIISNDDFGMALEDLKAQKAESAKTNVPKTQVSGIDFFNYLLTNTICANCSADI
ncbi:MAG: hypothetical protein PG981_000115 [Wolbachia endosymbiont of Ctenocephalides orientis wCori]|nr:MAG: hypothetical protein PG981_000115 [Wolbachia endosymbiont of Ctenocephalides orientis wCori]